MENRLVAHHVGGRGGYGRNFPVPLAFERDMINVMYEADEKCIPQIVEYGKTQPPETVVLPYCLSAKEGVCTFHINYDPYTSSVYSVNPRYAQFYFPVIRQNGYDYTIGDTFRTMEEVQLATTTLDAVVLDRGEVPGPDFLSLDAQGSELAILTGASRLLSTTILAVQSEVMLHPLYEGQPLFGDICQFLAQYNFDLVDMRVFSQKFRPIRSKLGFRGEGYVADGEALFLKRPETVETSAGGLQLSKLAYIATVFGRFECVQQCFETTGFEVMPPLQSMATDQQPRYLDFISRLAGAVELLPQRSALLFSDVISYAQSHAFFQIMAPQPQSRLRKYAKTLPPLVYVNRAVRGFLFRVLWILPRRLKALRRSAMMHARWRFKRPGSPVEALFLEFEMKDQYLLAMRNRIQDSEPPPKP